MKTEDGVEIGTLTAIPVEAPSVVDRTMIDIQVSTAKRFPRSITRSLEEAMTLATQDEKTAETMYYLLERSGKEIYGPSARLAEVMAHTWGNLAVAARSVEEGEKTVTAEATCWDMERNVGVRIRVERRITDRKGRKYNDDMVLVTSNAAVSVAFRNAVFKTIPRVYTDRIYQSAMKASVGDLQTIAAKRAAAVDFFSTRGVAPETLYAKLRVEGLDDIGVEEIIRLRGYANAIKDGEMSIETLFGAASEEEATEDLNAALAVDYLAEKFGTGKYEGRTIREVIGEGDLAYVRRYVIPSAGLEARKAIEAALTEAEARTRLERDPEPEPEKAPEAPEVPASDSPLDEVYRKVQVKAEALLRAGAEFSMDEGIRVDELRSAGDVEALVAFDDELASRLLRIEEKTDE